jgi:hypothetical protein
LEGFSLEDARQHLLEHVPGLYAAGLSTKSVHHLFHAPRKGTREAIKYHEQAHAKVARVRNDARAITEEVHFARAQQKLFREFHAYHNQPWYSGDDMNIIQVGRPAVSRYHRNRRFSWKAKGPTSKCMIGRSQRWESNWEVSCASMHLALTEQPPLADHGHDPCSPQTGQYLMVSYNYSASPRPATTVCGGKPKTYWPPIILPLIQCPPPPSSPGGRGDGVPGVGLCGSRAVATQGPTNCLPSRGSHLDGAGGGRPANPN